ncbi:hypothetical protein TL16_g02288 [Triparma laevis f. inornata]|uniref:Uncharacterized protein n=2 Tax=Triparma laevis TaxID=1534972 RepID=A0A9W6ZN96_9STRA|nr:hypothetical protein TrLO_g7691 [Triparma laevis f. longispina]GMH57093.1 hypothetical protein TL16_g02288 [Triparma laevis f. inornata]
MSKYVASESTELTESHKTGGKREEEDEGMEYGEDIIEADEAHNSTLISVSTAPPTWITKLRKPEIRAELNDRFVKFENSDKKSVLIDILHQRLRCEILLAGNNFLNTDDFRRLLVPFLPNDTLMTIRLASKPFSRVADRFISDGVESSTMMVHDGKDNLNPYFGEDEEGEEDEYFSALKERRKLVSRVIFFLDITKVGECACHYAANLIVVDIPEGVTTIGNVAFSGCSSLTTVSFPTTLISIGVWSFGYCSSLDNIDLLHTNLQELGQAAFARCSELKSMTIPDSLQTLGLQVFYACFKLVPSNINVNNQTIDSRSEVVAHLRSLQTPT